MKLYLIFLNVWIASVYYMIYCEPRSYNSALAGFWGIMAIFWIYDLKVNYTPFDRTHKHTALAVLLCMLPLAYPLFSIIRGMSFPMMTSPVMPCSVAVFTIGLLLAFSKRVNIFLVMFLCIIRKTKCFDFWERNVLFPKTKRSFFRTPTPLPCPFPLNFSLLIITKKFGNLAKNRYICIV